MANINGNGSWMWEVMRSNKDELTLVALLSVLVLMLATLWYKLILSISPKSSPPLPPGPLSLPIVGYIPFLRTDLHKQLTEMSQTFGPIFKFYLGSKLHVIINTQELAKEIVRDHDEIFANHDLTIVASIMTYGGQDVVYSKNNATWRKHRKIFVQEVLSNKNLEAGSYLRTASVRKVVKNVFNKAGTTVNIGEISFFTELNILIGMVMENTLDEAGKKNHDELHALIGNFKELLGRVNWSDLFPSLAWLDIQGIERDVKKLREKMEEITTKIIEDRINANSKKFHDENGYQQKRDFLQVLLDLKDKNDETAVTMTQIKLLLIDTLVGGSDTTETLFTWAMAEIMKNHGVMKRIQEELEEIVGLNNIVEESHLSKLQYLDATIKETLRLHPLGPFLVPRWNSKTCIVGGYTIPKGSTIFINAWSIHHDPRHWDNPFEFNPDRFLSFEGTNKFDYNGKNMNFLPFGAGRRLCPGILLAKKMQMFILASLLHSFDWSLPKGKEHDLTEKLSSQLQKRKPLIAIPSQRLQNVKLYL